MKDNESDVENDIEDLPIFSCLACPSCEASTWYGLESSIIFPSRTFTIRVAYSSASSGLCVTITTSLSFATSFRSSITWTLVSESSAPVGSSASKISGSLINARAIATRCICPPDIWLGFLWSWLPNPTFSKASIARFLRSDFETPEIVSASSTFESTVWWGIKL